MTLAQLAIASRSSVAWLNNARRLTGRRIHRTPNGARWWGMIRILNSELGISLGSSVILADTILGAPHTTHRVRIAASTDHSVALHFDLERFHSTANAALAAALAFSQPKSRGRPKRASAERARPRVAPISEVWVIRVEDSPAALERLSHHLKEWGAYPRGIEGGLPFIMDAATLKAVPRLALSTTEKGPIDVLVTGPSPLGDPVPQPL